MIVDPMPGVNEILGRVSDLRLEIEDGGRRSEELRTCPPDLVASLREARLFSLKTPAKVGGLELPFVDQMRVFEEVARLDSNVGWTVMIGNGAAGLVGVHLSDQAVPEVFAGPTLPLMAFALFPPAVAIPDGDGYIVSGRPSFASGVSHAEWVALGGVITDEAGTVDPSVGLRVFVVPRAAITIHDNWDVMGLQGTGSCDFSVEQLRVDPEFVLDPLNGEARRGGPCFRMPPFLFVANEHLGFALGVARRALDEATAVAQGKLRLGSTTTTAHRGSFQEQLGRHDLALRSARLLAFDTLAGVCADVEGDGHPMPGAVENVMAVGAYVTGIAIEVCTWAFKVGGAHALYRSHPLQRCLRDMIAGANHVYVKDENLDLWGRHLLGIA
jgi:indole-3-acetate monooxygenase